MKLTSETLKLITAGTCTAAAAVQLAEWSVNNVQHLRWRCGTDVKISAVTPEWPSTQH